MAGSFREGAGPGDAPPPTPTPPLAQYLSLDSLPWGPADPKHQHWRHAELRRALAADDQADELRRIRASVADSTGKAKEKVRSLQEAIHKLDKYKNIVTRKRQRSELGADKLGGGSSSGALRIGAQNSSTVMSKRVRSSLTDGRLDGRGSVSSRQGPLVNNERNSPVEKEKNARTPGSVPVLSEDKLRGLSTGGDGWEKKMRRKRSVGTMLNRGNDADRDVKPVGQHRPANEVRPRSIEGVAHRHGASSGVLAGNKMDGNSQQSNIVSRLLTKTDVDCATLPNERRERHAGIEKERTMVKGNKAHTSEDMQNGSLSPLPKAKACRAPRTSSLVMNSSSTFQRSTGGSDDWEETPYINKASPLGGMTKSKRSAHSNSSSPPIAWGGQRPQKMSRTRRANVVSPVSNFDEVLSEGSPLDTAARSAAIETGIAHLTKNAQGVTKIDSISSPAGLSESEGSAATESKAKEKAMHNGEVGNEGANATALIFSSNKNRIPLKEELEDGGVRRQGRSGRGMMHVKGCSSIPREKLDTAETRKPLKGGRPGSEKNESKLGRPPMKKGSDRKASSWHSQTLSSESADVTGESEDDREELLAAVNAARSAISGAYAGPFWKKMEPMLTFISSDNLSFLRSQIDIVEELEMSMSCLSDSDHNVIATTDCRTLQTMGKTNGVGTKGPIDCLSPTLENHKSGSQKVEADEWFTEMAPMTHRLLSALIVEDDFSDSNGLHKDVLVEFPSSHIPYTVNRYLENEFQASAMTSNFGLSVDFTHSNNTSVVNQSLCNGFTSSSSFIISNSQHSTHSESLSDGAHSTMYPENVPLHDVLPQISRQCQNPAQSFPSSPYEYQYGQMSVNDKILIELQSIGICPESVPNLDDGEDEDINKMISELRKRLHDQVTQKKSRLHKLDKAIHDTKNIEERSLEQHAMNKLIERAYRKLKGGRSSHKAGVSKSANKAAKQLALAFAKRTLVRCQKFEETGKSCFSEPSLWSVLAAPLPCSDVKAEGVERLKHQKLDRSPLDQGGTKWKKSDRERDHSRDASAKGSSLKSGRHSSGSGRSGERKNKTKPKQKLAQLSTSGNVLGRVVEPFSTPAVQEPPEPPVAKVTQHPHPRNTPANAAHRSTDAPLTNLPGLDDILDVPEGLDEQGNDISSWFTDGLDDSLQDIDFSGALEIPDDDLTQLAFI
ncbi:hypothetical protein ACP70R_031949 [Stipagrostis hirtigluma subsp. patula]